MKGVRKLTPTEALKSEAAYWKLKHDQLFLECSVLKAENVLYKQFNDLHFKQGITSLVKALRVSIYALSNKGDKR